MKENETLLHRNWSFWFHKIDNITWEMDSYRLVYSFNDILDFWKLFNNINAFHLGMSFIMKKGILPIYEDKENIDGGVWSFRILRKDLMQVWLDLNLGLIGETLSDNMEDINGISINPKNCVIKIWMKKCPEEDAECPIKNEIPNFDSTKAIFMVNLEKSKNSNKPKPVENEVEKQYKTKIVKKPYKNIKKKVSNETEI